MNLLALYCILETTLSLASKILKFSPLIYLCACVCGFACVCMHGAYIVSVYKVLAIEIEMEKMLAPALLTVFFNHYPCHDLQGLCVLKLV